MRYPRLCHVVGEQKSASVTAKVQDEVAGLFKRLGVNVAVMIEVTACRKERLQRNRNEACRSRPRKTEVTIQLEPRKEGVLLVFSSNRAHLSLVQQWRVRRGARECKRNSALAFETLLHDRLPGDSMSSARVVARLIINPTLLQEPRTRNHLECSKTFEIVGKKIIVFALRAYMVLRDDSV